MMEQGQTCLDMSNREVLTHDQSQIDRSVPKNGSGNLNSRPPRMSTKSRLVGHKNAPCGLRQAMRNAIDTLETG